MGLQTQLEIGHDSYASAITTLANLLTEKYGVEKAESVAYNIPESLKDENKEIVEAFKDAQNLILINNFEHLVNEPDEYRAGDLWVLADAVEIEEKISEDLYEQV